MADITITEFNPIFDPPPYDLYTAPAAVDLTAAMAVVLDSSGLLAKADADLPWPFRVRGLVTKTTLQNYAANAFRGRAYIDGLGSVAMGTDLFLSKTIGLLADVDPGVDELQTLTITGTPTGGDFTLTFMGCTTAAIAYNATAADVQAALFLLPSIGGDNVLCGGGALPSTAVTMLFRNGLGRTNLPLMTGTFSGLTGGSSPDGSIAETTPGVNSIVVARVIPLWDGLTVRKIIEIL
jgi:hypothetical protein